MALPEGPGKLTSGVSLGERARRWFPAKRSRWRSVSLTFGQTRLLECPDCGSLVATPEGKLNHIERCRLAHWHDDMSDDDQQEEIEQ